MTNSTEPWGRIVALPGEPGAPDRAAFEVHANGQSLLVNATFDKRGATRAKLEELFDEPFTIKKGQNGSREFDSLAQLNLVEPLDGRRFPSYRGARKLTATEVITLLEQVQFYYENWRTVRGLHPITNFVGVLPKGRLSTEEKKARGLTP